MSRYHFKNGSILHINWIVINIGSLLFFNKNVLSFNIFGIFELKKLLNLKNSNCDMLTKLTQHKLFITKLD